MKARLHKLFGHAGFWVGLVLLIFTFNIVRAVTKEIPEPPKVLIELPEFSLTDQTGKAFGSKDLVGKIWIANFIFTSCPTLCPQLTKHMQAVKHRLRGMGDAVHLVSFSVDPERDTPERLTEYSRKYGASPQRWSFLTGPLGAVEEAVVGGFKLPMDKDDDADERTAFDITHGTRFVLVDTENRIRGYYETTEEELDRIIYDVGLLSAALMRERQAVAQR